MSKQPHEATMLEQQLKASLDDSTQALPAHVVSRLRQAREQAVQVQSPRIKSNSRWWQFSFATYHPWMTACASVITLAVLVGYSQFARDPALDNLEQETEILFADEDLDLYEDLEFYRWLANTGY